MQSQDPELSASATKIADDEANDRAPRAARHYQSPDLLIADESLSDPEKLALLQDWDVEIDNRLKAEEEGMSASDPIHARREAKLAEEAMRVKSHLVELTAKLANFR